jgi:hypothetical protein
MAKQLKYWKTEGMLVEAFGKYQIATGLHYCCQNGHAILTKDGIWMRIKEYEEFHHIEEGNFFIVLKNNNDKIYGLVDAPTQVINSKKLNESFFYKCDNEAETGEFISFCKDDDNFANF